MFKVGQKVVCISKKTWVGKNDRKPPTNNPKIPKRNFVYEIDGFYPSDSRYIYLVGFNSTTPEGNRYCFDSKEFKPYVDPQEEMNKVKEEILNKELILN